MFFYFNFRNICISFKKFRFFIKNILNISNYFFEILVYLNFILNKFSYILKKIFNNIFNSLKNKVSNIFILKINYIFLSKGNIYKRSNYRAKGIFNFILKKYCNIHLSFLNG